MLLKDCIIPSETQTQTHTHVRHLRVVRNQCVLTSSSDAPFSEYDTQSMSLKDPKLSIFFESQEMMDDSLMLLRFNCPDPECPFIARGWNDLKTHVKVLHKKMMWYVTILSTEMSSF